MKEKPLYLSLAFILSAMLHIGFIAHLSGVKWFQLSQLAQDGIIDVDLSQERDQPKEPVRPSEIERISEKTEKRAPFKVEAPPAGSGKNTQELKADAAQSVPSSGGSNPPLLFGGQAVPSIKPAAGSPATAKEEKTEATGPALMSAPSERFLYDISWAGIHVGQAVLEASNENGKIKIISRVHSAAVISLLYKVEDFSESTIVNGAPAHFRIRQHEGKYRSDKDTVFDGDGGKIIFYNYLNNTMEEHPIRGGLPWDVMSGFYYLRNMPLVEGHTVYVDVFDSGKFLKVAVSVVRKERIKVPGAGDVDTVMVRLLLSSDGLFKSKGNVNIWLTDDCRRIPVRVQTKVPIGSVTAELSSMERGS